MKTLLCILLFAFTATAQLNWQLVGTGRHDLLKEEVIVFYDDTSVAKIGNEVGFRLFYAKFIPPDIVKDGEHKLMFSEDYFVFNIITADCKSFKYAVLQQYGKWGFKDKKPVELNYLYEGTTHTTQAKTKQLVYKAIVLACAEKPDKITTPELITKGKNNG
jgi:hypothetical protein